MPEKYMTLDELSDLMAKELYEVAEASQSIQLSASSSKRTFVYGLQISENETKKELLKRIIENPDFDWEYSDIDKKIIEQIRMAKHDNSDLSKEFMNSVNMFVANLNIDVFNYTYENRKKIKNRLIRTVLTKKLVSAPANVKLKDVDWAELYLDLLYAYPYTDHNLINGYPDNIDLYEVSHIYNMHQVYDRFYQFMWNRILAEASKAKPDTMKIENLCNVAVTKLIGINASQAYDKKDKSISEYSLRNIFNTQNVLFFAKEHSDEIKQKQHQDFFNQIRMNEAQALLYKQTTDKKRAPDSIALMQGSARDMG